MNRESWTVLNNTLGWDAAPYTASFGLAKSGDYTLKVNFEQQKYDGNILAADQYNRYTSGIIFHHKG